MRRSVLFAAAAVLVLSGCGESRAEDAGPDVSRSFQVAGFDRIEVAGPYNVQVTTGTQPGVSARGPDKIVGHMVVEVENGTLKIHPEKRKGMFGGWNWGSQRGTAQVAVNVPMLRAAEIAGSGDMNINRIATDSFRGAIAGSGNLKLGEVQVKELGLEIAGSGNVVGKGEAQSVHYEVAGSGNIRGGEIASDVANVEIAGSGNIDAHARSTAKVEIAGVGNVRITGGAKCTIDKAGVGNVVCS
jgi:hypothetical protein